LAVGVRQNQIFSKLSKPLVAQPASVNSALPLQAAGTEGTEPNHKKIQEYVERSLMLVTALAPVIGYDKASRIAHYAMDNDLTLKSAALKLGFVTEPEFDRIVDPVKMVKPYVAEIKVPLAIGAKAV